MQDMFASARMAIYLAPCAGLLLISSSDLASSQILGPGWPLAFAGQPSFGGSGGDGAGQAAIPHADQPALAHDQEAQLQQPSPYQSAPVYAQQVQPSPPGANRSGPVYYRQVPAPQQPGALQSLFQLFQSPPAAQPSTNQPAQVSHRPAAASQPSAPEPAPPSYQLAAAAQQGGSQSAQTFYQPAPPPPSPQQGPFAPFFQLFQSAPAPQPRATWNNPAPSYAPSGQGDMAHPMVDPKYDRQLVDYQGNERPGTIIIDSPHYFLYLVMEGGKALRYGIGVGRPGFTWAGVKEVSAKREWPDWYPPVEMLQRRPDLPRYMPGGPANPLGARALYLGSTLYRIHGSNEPWTIGTQVSSGCIRLRNEDVIDLYQRVKVGTKVVVI
jgi:lipoprotein-anchoring transpeptidase ErfK/SrfK